MATTTAATSPSINTAPLVDTGRPRRAAASRAPNISPSPTAASAVTSSSTRSRRRLSRSNSRALPSPDKTIVALPSPEPSAIAMSRAPSSSAASASAAGASGDPSVPPPSTTPLTNGGRGLKRRQSAASGTPEDKRRRLSDGADGKAGTSQNAGEIASAPPKITMKLDFSAAAKTATPGTLRFTVGKSSRQSASPTKRNGKLPSEPPTPSLAPSQPATEPPTRAGSVEASTSEVALAGGSGSASSSTAPAAPTSSPAAPAKGKYAKRKSRRPHRRGEVDPDDPVAVAKQKERQAMIDRAIEDIDLQIKLIKSDAGHPSINAMLAELDRRYNKLAEQSKARYHAALGDLQKSRGFARQQAHADFIAKREDLAEAMTTENRRIMSRIRQERTHLAVVPNTYPLLRDGQGGGGWIVHDDRLVSKGTFPTVPVMLDGELRERLDLSVDVRGTTSAETASDLRRVKDAVANRNNSRGNERSELTGRGPGQSSSRNLHGQRHNSYSTASTTSTPGIAIGSSSDSQAHVPTTERTKQTYSTFGSTSTDSRPRQETSTQSQSQSRSQGRQHGWDKYASNLTSLVDEAARADKRYKEDERAARAAASSASTSTAPSSTSADYRQPASATSYGFGTSASSYISPGVSSISSRNSRTIGTLGTSTPATGNAGSRTSQTGSASASASGSGFPYWPTTNRSRDSLYGSTSTTLAHRERERETERERDRLKLEREEADRRARERAAKNAEASREKRKREEEKAREEREWQLARERTYASWGLPSRPVSVLDSHRPPAGTTAVAAASSSSLSSTPTAGSLSASGSTSRSAPFDPVRSASKTYASTAGRDTRPAASTNGAGSSTAGAETSAARPTSTSTSLSSRLYGQKNTDDAYGRVGPRWDALWGSREGQGSSRDSSATAARSTSGTTTSTATAAAASATRPASSTQPNGSSSAARANGTATSPVATSAVPASTSARDTASGDRRLDTTSARASSSISGSGLTSSNVLPPLPSVSASSTSGRTSGSDYFSKYGAGSYGGSGIRPFSASFLYGLGSAPLPPSKSSSSTTTTTTPSSAGARRPAANGDAAASRSLSGQTRDGAK